MRTVHIEGNGCVSCTSRARNEVNWDAVGAIGEIAVALRAVSPAPDPASLP